MGYELLIRQSHEAICYHDWNYFWAYCFTSTALSAGSRKLLRNDPSIALRAG